jgi:hypothetical protein
MHSRDDDDARRRGAYGTARDWRGDDERRGGYQGRGQQEAFQGRGTQMGGYDPYEQGQEYGRGAGGSDYGSGETSFWRGDEQQRMYERPRGGAYGRGYQGRDSWRTHASDESRYGGFDREQGGGVGGSIMSDYGSAQQEPWQGSGMPRHTGTARSWSGEYGRAGGYGGYGGGREQERQWDPDYHQWRSEQLRRLDEDYEAFRKERYGKFSEEFNTWRANRASQSPAAGPGAATGTGSSSGGGSGSASPSSRSASTSSGMATSGGGKGSETKQQG